MSHPESAASESRGRFAPGDTIAPRELTTIRSETLRLPDPGSLTHLQFRRFAACPICNVHLRPFAQRHDELIAAGVQEVVVFHSSTEAMLPHQGDLPFAAIADPERDLYDEFGVQRSMRAILHPKTWASPLNPATYPVVVRELRSGGKSLRSSESKIGLPADFLIGADGRILAAKYGRHASDQWSFEEVVLLAWQAAQR
jgi:peroxiredoxin